MKILLIGAGNMGSAMLEGLQNYNTTVVETTQKKLDELKLKYPTVTVISKIPNLDDFIVILAIKPQSLYQLNTKGKAQGLISILAGTNLEKLKSKVDAKFYVRAIPNIAALVKKSATSLCGDNELKDIAIELLSSFGKCFWLESEKELDIATGLVGSAPAWLALVAEALSDGAVNLGLKREISYEYIATLFEGTGIILHDIHPALLKDKVTSPNGTTIAGITKLEEGRVRDGFIKAINASYKKTKKM